MGSPCQTLSMKTGKTRKSHQNNETHHDAALKSLQEMSFLSKGINDHRLGWIFYSQLLLAQ
jgi:hypothetical protein